MPDPTSPIEFQYTFSFTGDLSQEKAEEALAAGQAAIKAKLQEEVDITSEDGVIVIGS